MTSLRQITANRQNARKSTGPRTKVGKARIRKNAIRHGLTAETVIGDLEAWQEYESFQTQILADIAPQSAIEQELALRLASLLWRLRRATMIETGLFQIQREILVEQLPGNVPPPPSEVNHGWADSLIIGQTLSQTLEPAGLAAKTRCRRVSTGKMSCRRNGKDNGIRTSTYIGKDAARAFLRLANLDNAIFERLGRYEASLWRRVTQTVNALATVQRQGTSAWPW